MQYIILPQLFLIMTSVNSNHTSKQTENKDVIVTYSNHADAEAEKTEVSKPNEKITEKIPDKIILMPEHMFGKKATMEKERNDRNDERDSNEVVFIPNQKEVVRNEDYLNNPRIDDVMHNNIRTIDDAMARRPIISNTESPVNSDIIFLTGKNNENDFKESERDRPIHGDARRSETVIYTTVVPILDCVHLDCDNAVDSVCGAKLERKTWKYRLFLNECFFRKVNCYFQNEYNRYRQIPIENCQNAGVHRRNSNPLPQPMYYPPMEKPVTIIDNTRRNIASRRSLTLSVDGHACSHACPVSCPDDYEPECAVSGQIRKVFVNHCKLDYNSCVNNMVWHSRPLAQCVGGKRADAQQNRAFIDWMQRVGIVDNKGKLVLS